MSVTTISRYAFNEDTGDGESGDIVTAALIGLAFYDKVDAVIAADITFGGAITERNRAAAMGVWTDFTPVRTAGSGTWTGGTIQTAQYMLVGKTLWVNFSVENSTNSALTANLMITVPGGFTAAKQAQSQMFLSLGGTGQGANLFVGLAAPTTLIIAPLAGGNIAATAGTVITRGQIAFEIL